MHAVRGTFFYHLSNYLSTFRDLRYTIIEMIYSPQLLITWFLSRFLSMLFFTFPLHDHDHVIYRHLFPVFRECFDFTSITRTACPGQTLCNASWSQSTTDGRMLCATSSIHFAAVLHSTMHPELVFSARWTVRLAVQLAVQQVEILARILAGHQDTKKPATFSEPRQGQGRSHVIQRSLMGCWEAQISHLHNGKHRRELLWTARYRCGQAVWSHDKYGHCFVSTNQQTKTRLEILTCRISQFVSDFLLLSYPNQTTRRKYNDENKEPMNHQLFPPQETPSFAWSTIITLFATWSIAMVDDALSFVLLFVYTRIYISKLQLVFDLLASKQRIDWLLYSRVWQG